MNVAHVTNFFKIPLKHPQNFNEPRSEDNRKWSSLKIYSLNFKLWSVLGMLVIERTYCFSSRNDKCAVNLSNKSRNNRHIIHQVVKFKPLGSVWKSGCGKIRFYIYLTAVHFKIYFRVSKSKNQKSWFWKYQTLELMI